MGYAADFSPDGRLFALLDSDGKLKIWDIKGNRLIQEYVPNLHLSQPYTCFVWFSVCNGKNGTSLFIALGTSKGGVDLYSHATGKLYRKLKGDGHAGAVTSICLHSDTTLYTCGEDCKIFEWSLEKSAAVKHFAIDNITPTCIISLPMSKTLLVGCKELHQWSLEKQPRKMSTLTGHPADVSSMKVFTVIDRCEEYVVTTAKNNREMYLWKIGTKKNPRGTFLMEHGGSVVSCSIVDRKLIIAAVTQAFGSSSGIHNGVVHLFVVDDISDIGKQQNPKVTLAVAFDSKTVEPLPIVAATTNFSKPNSILIGYGKSPTFSFDDVSYNLKEKKQTIHREDPRLQVSRQQKTKESSNTFVPDPKHQPTYNPPKPIRKDGRPMEELVDALNRDQSSDDVKGHSLVEALKQALNNHDATNIRTVLATKDENVIRSTLKRLPAQYVSTLIDELTLLTQKKTANVQTAVRWLKLLLQIHASQLMALGKDELHDRFGRLLGIIEHRTHSLHQLTALSGRLDFLLNQIKRNTDDDPIFNHENLLVIQDEPSDEEKSDAETNGNGSDSSDQDDLEDAAMNGGSTSDDDQSDESMSGSGN